MSINKRRFAMRHARTKRETYINPHYSSIEVGDKIVIHAGRKNHKVTVLSSTATQIKVHIVYHSEFEEDQTYSKTTGNRIRCSEWDTQDKIVMMYDPYRLMTWEDVDEANKATEAHERKDAKARRLNDFKFSRLTLTEEQLDEVIALIESFDKEV